MVLLNNKVSRKPVEMSEYLFWCLQYFDSMVAIPNIFESLLCCPYSDLRECWVAVPARGTLVRLTCLAFTFSTRCRLIRTSGTGLSRVGEVPESAAGVGLWVRRNQLRDSAPLPSCGYMRFPSSVRPTSLLLWFAFYFTHIDLIKTSCSWIRFEVWR